MEAVAAESLLPIEMWGNVFQHAEAKDAPNFRLVCSAWKKELDSHFHQWTLRLDQTSPYFKQFLQLKVKEATILNLLTPVVMDQEGSPRLFKHPELLEKLSIRPRISSENLLLLFNSCGQTIKHLDLEVGLFREVLANPSYNLHPNGFEFPNLQCLKLDFTFTSYPHRPIQQFSLSLFNLMVGLSTMKKVKYLTLALSHHCTVLSSTVLAFIGKNGRKLEEIDCDLQPNCVDERPAQLPAVDLAQLKQVRKLKKIIIQCAGALGEHFGMARRLERAWETLLEGQNNLTHLILRGLRIKPRILRLICRNNQYTLTNIEIQDFDFVIDLRLFTGCMHLKELRLILDKLYASGQRLQNAASLPAGIQKFQSKNYFMESDDIRAFFCIGHGELAEIKLDNSGLSGPDGVTAAIFADFVANRHLNNNLRIIDISSFNCSTAQDGTDLNNTVRGLDPAWEDKQDFRTVGIRMDRTMDEGGDWSVWGIRAYSGLLIHARNRITIYCQFQNVIN